MRRHPRHITRHRTQPVGANCVRPPQGTTTAQTGERSSPLRLGTLPRCASRMTPDPPPAVCPIKNALRSFRRTRKRVLQPSPLGKANARRIVTSNIPINQNLKVKLGFIRTLNTPHKIAFLLAPQGSRLLRKPSPQGEAFRSKCASPTNQNLNARLEFME